MWQCCPHVHDPVIVSKKKKQWVSGSREGKKSTSESAASRGRRRRRVRSKVLTWRFFCVLCLFFFFCGCLSPCWPLSAALDFLCFRMVVVHLVVSNTLVVNLQFFVLCGPVALRDTAVELMHPVAATLFAPPSPAVCLPLLGPWQSHASKTFVRHPYEMPLVPFHPCTT